MAKIIVTLVLTISFGAVSKTTLASTSIPASLQSVHYVDLSRYAGVWYDIAHYPSKYQAGCQDSITSFSLRNNGDIDVLNSCHDKQNGSLHHADGHGWVTDTSSNARLKISYFWPFRNEYVVIDQGKDYEYSVICTADKKHLWIIARTPSISSDVFEKIVTAIEKQGFHRTNLIKTEHIRNLPSEQVNAR